MRVVDTVLWKSLQWPGHESARLLDLDDRWELEGSAVFSNDGEPCRLDYTVACERDWRTRGTRVEGWIGDRVIDVVVACVNDVWTLNGIEQPQLTGCIDADLNFSPSTNLLPIRRLELQTGESQIVRAAWLRFPSFALEVLEQRYTRVADDRVRYESFTTNFSAEMRLTANGMVLDYENVWAQER